MARLDQTVSTSSQYTAALDAIFKGSSSSRTSVMFDSHSAPSQVPSGSSTYLAYLTAVCVPDSAANMINLKNYALVSYLFTWH